MFNSKAIYGVFILAAILFVAKPFIGFKVFSSFNKKTIANSVVVKIFSKRKPEDLADAGKKKAAIAQQLSNPHMKLLVTIFTWLSFFFFWSEIPFSKRFYSFFCSSQSPPLYLLTGKLTI